MCVLDAIRDTSHEEEQYNNTTKVLVGVNDSHSSLDQQKVFGAVEQLLLAAAVIRSYAVVAYLSQVKFSRDKTWLYGLAGSLKWFAWCVRGFSVVRTLADSINECRLILHVDRISMRYNTVSTHFRGKLSRPFAS